MGEHSLTATCCFWLERETMTVPVTDATEDFEY